MLPLISTKGFHDLCTLQVFFFLLMKIIDFLTKAQRVTVSIMAKGCIVARVLPLRCFLFLLPNYTNI